MGKARGNRQRTWLLVGIAVAIGGTASAGWGQTLPGTETAPVIKSGNTVSQKVLLDEVDFSDSGTVNGVVVNKTAAVLRDVRLLVRYDWRWRNERSPGEHSPARSAYFTITTDIPALGTLPFRFSPTPPLPIRADGHYSPSIEVARYTQVRYKKVLRKIER